jgi:hypothetical protein
MAQDRMFVEIVKGKGIIKVTTDPIGPENHLSATEMLKFIARKAGGEVETVKRTDAIHDHHEHTHEHEHEHH